MKTMTVTKEKNTFLQGLDFLTYGLEIFGFIGFELVLAYGIEFNVYGCDFKGFTVMQSILHWVLTCAVWLFGAFIAVRDGQKKCLFSNGYYLLQERRSASSQHG